MFGTQYDIERVCGLRELVHADVADRGAEVDIVEEALGGLALAGMGLLEFLACLQK